MAVKAAEVLAEMARRKAAREKLAPLIEALHPKQRAFVQDPAKRKTGVCSRRAGKSHGIGVWLLEGAALSMPETLCPYIATTRGHAKRILWPTLHQLDSKYNLGLHFTDSELYADWPGGGRIWVTGCPDAAHAEVYRGPPYRRVAIDEGASFPSYLEMLVNEILDPALMDWAGELAMIGSPGVSLSGLFYESSQPGAEWSVHEWTVLDNPFVRDPAAYLADVLRKNKWTRDHPTFVREYLGRWVKDLGMLVYKITDTAIEIGLPSVARGGWRFVLSIDIGASEYHPTTAFALLAYHPSCLSAFVVRSWAEAGMTPSSIAERIREIMTGYAVEAIVMDPGGLGGGYVKEMIERHALPVEAAEKSSKRAYQEMLNGDLVTGRLKLIESETKGLRSEAATLAWKSAARLEEGDQPNHQCDAMLYGWRRCRQYLSAEPEKPKPGACAEEEAIIRDLERAERAKHERASFVKRRWAR